MERAIDDFGRGFEVRRNAKNKILCADCDEYATGKVHGIPMCADHADQAMSHIEEDDLEDRGII